MYEKKNIYLLKNIVCIFIIVFFIVNNGNILKGGGQKNERERIQREL